LTGDGGQTFRGGITGAISDASGASISGANVQAINVSTGLRRDATTSTAGEFAFPDLPLGEYQVTASQTGFDQLKVDKVEVEVGKVTSLRLTLKVASQSRSVEVAATAVNIDVDTSTLNEVIPDKAVQDMPLNGRDFTQLVKLAPGLNGAGSINGAHSSKQLADRQSGQQRPVAQFRGRQPGRCVGHRGNAVAPSTPSISSPFRATPTPRRAATAADPSTW